VSDYLTRFHLAFALPDATAPTVAKVLVEHIFLFFGPPRVILSDQAKNFNDELLTAIMDLFKIRKVTSSGYRPQTAGLIERLNQTLLDMLAIYTDRCQFDWDEFIPYVLHLHIGLATTRLSTAFPLS